MMAGRIWNLRVNLDDFNAAFAALADDVERSQFLAGLSRGMNAGGARDGAPPAWLEGFALGSSMRAEADGFHARKSLAGQRSAEVRRAASGSAQPRAATSAPDQSPNTVRGIPEHPSNTPRTPPEPIHNPQSKDEKLKNPPTPQGGRLKGFARLFSDNPEALPWFERCISARSSFREWAAERAHKTGEKLFCPENQPSRDAAVFLARCAEAPPRILHACLQLALLDQRAAGKLACPRLQVFFGEANGKKRADWLGFLERAEAKVSAAVAQAAAPPPPPVPAGPPGPPAAPTLPPSLLALTGVPLPLGS